MVIAISTNTNDLDQPVSENFGRCQWFCLYDTDTQNMRFVENIAGSAKQNAGIKTINFLLELNIDTVLSGRFGTITTVLLREKNIQIIIPLKTKTLNEIINQLKNQNL
ncbi:NifB/NifX family molybdenum-iron cluster-binding protein [Dysgonomonas termitidis]|uniref:NifB/NifX family molybdenum-iron cluster-binding protein n=1 Tax=Dysgonomonas termitidis TaxID=1516126 RepID=A0ABV9KYI5_9BACT